MRQGLCAGRGYVLREGPYAVVIGGANMDICGCSYDNLRIGDSSPGRVRTSAGGVGRNIAENLARLGHRHPVADCGGQRSIRPPPAGGEPARRGRRAPGAGTGGSVDLLLSQPARWQRRDELRRQRHGDHRAAHPARLTPERFSRCGGSGCSTPTSPPTPWTGCSSAGGHIIFVDTVSVARVRRSAPGCTASTPSNPIAPRRRSSCAASPSAGPTPGPWQRPGSTAPGCSGSS